MLMVWEMTENVTEMFMEFIYKWSMHDLHITF